MFSKIMNAQRKPVAASKPAPKPTPKPTPKPAPKPVAEKPLHTAGRSMNQVRDSLNLTSAAMHKPRAKPTTLAADSEPDSEPETGEDEATAMGVPATADDYCDDGAEEEEGFDSLKDGQDDSEAETGEEEDEEMPVPVTPKPKAKAKAKSSKAAATQAVKLQRLELELAAQLRAGDHPGSSVKIENAYQLSCDEGEEAKFVLSTVPPKKYGTVGLMKHFTVLRPNDVEDHSEGKPERRHVIFAAESKTEGGEPRLFGPNKLQCMLSVVRSGEELKVLDARTATHIAKTLASEVGLKLDSFLVLVGRCCNRAADGRPVLPPTYFFREATKRKLEIRFKKPDPPLDLAEARRLAAGKSKPRAEAAPKPTPRSTPEAECTATPVLQAPSTQQRLLKGAADLVRIAEEMKKLLMAEDLGAALTPAKAPSRPIPVAPSSPPLPPAKKRASLADRVAARKGLKGKKKQRRNVVDLDVESGDDDSEADAFKPDEADLKMIDDRSDSQISASESESEDPADHRERRRERRREEKHRKRRRRDYSSDEEEEEEESETEKSVEEEDPRDCRPVKKPRRRERQGRGRKRRRQRDYSSEEEESESGGERRRSRDKARKNRRRR